ncbi:hypothetical protein B4589_006920 [Halolamina sp. CBA1230]|uniref:hypothetical protein n=1 Tax=Halolamina sp. CBA1230 TaxID=1853690 RepID=UPI00130202DC|nr:hypothetical protein [Halolamina sp. CBA1230]QKY18821.1 hypothetical protein B4589_006920 [Halolamina sp. CBA1230]
MEAQNPATGERVKSSEEHSPAAVDAGSTAVAGGEPLDREGAFSPPTVLTDVPVE